MATLSFPSYGEKGIYLQYGGSIVDSAVSLDAALLNPPTKYHFYYKTGQNAGLVDGVVLTITGGSAAVLKVKTVIISQGALGDSNAMGVIFYDLVSGAHPLTGETLKVAATTYAVTTSGAIDSPQTAARGALIRVESNTIRFTFGGDTPVNSAGTPVSHGTPLLANESVQLDGYENLRTLKFINAVSTSDALVNVTLTY